MRDPEPIRRVVTGHDASGTAVVVLDGSALNVTVRPALGVVGRLLWVTDESPALVSPHADRANRVIGAQPPAGGSALRVVDFLPVSSIAQADGQAPLSEVIGAESQTQVGGLARHPFMHRTRTIDYAIVLQGEIDMLLDDSEVHLRAGEVVVQQGTNHAWVNRSNELCRIAFVMIDAVDPLEARP